jgi:hypothetical protein
MQNFLLIESGVEGKFSMHWHCPAPAFATRTRDYRFFAAGRDRIWSRRIKSREFYYSSVGIANFNRTISVYVYNVSTNRVWYGQNIDHMYNLLVNTLHT